MEWILALLAVGSALLWTSAAWAAIVKGRRVPFLRDLSAPIDRSRRVSVVVAARNEEEKLRECLVRLLRLKQLDLQLIAVNDRSEDATGRDVKKRP